MPDILTITCPSCGGKGRIIEGTNRFHCDYCGNEHLIEMSFQQVPAPSLTRAAQPEMIRPLALHPTNIRTEKDAGSARIVQRWFSLKYVPMAFFCVAWDAFLFFWYSMVLGAGAPWIFVVFPIVHLAVGVGLTYSTLCGFVNRTVVELTRDELSVWFEPLPWLGEKTVKTSTIKQLFCKETRHSGKNGVSYKYHLYAVTHDLREEKIMSNLDTAEAVHFFEQQLETCLHITNQPVAGEV